MIKKKIKDEHVIEFLKNNPKFFIENSSLLDEILFPSDTRVFDKDSTNVIQFKDWIIENLKNKQKNIIDNAHYNFLTQNKIHKTVINILRISKFKDLTKHIIDVLPKVFNLEIINIVTSEDRFSKSFHFIHKNSEDIEKIFGKESQLIVDAVEHKSGIFKNLDKKIYSNAIFSLSKKILGSKSLLVFGSSDKHFIDNKAYDLILFLSNVLQEQLIKLSNDK